MNLEPQIQKQPLLASCPNCRQRTLMLVQINMRKKKSKIEQVLTCRSCRLMIPVDEFKNLICTV
ncbi:MAG: hypothetical protein R3230_01845 [Nitrosopumilaceae archaeon]|nr:hypothetical protein [Nitrosopumilaceae archaeon]